MSRKFLVPIVLPADPAAPMEAATKQYVDALSGNEVFIGPNTPGDPLVELWVDEDDIANPGDEVFVGPDDPILLAPNVELWYDTDDPTGNAGSLPAGGSAGQVLTKNSNVDYDDAWMYTSLPIFATAAARDAAMPAVTAGNGKMCVTLDTNRVWQIISNAWVLVAGSMPRCFLTRTGVQSITSWGQIGFTAESYDTDNLHDNVTNNTRITIPAGLAGLWTFSYSFYVEALASAGRVVGQVVKNGSLTPSYGSNGGSQVANDDGGRSGTADILMVAGDYCEAWCYTSAARNIGSASGPYATFSASYRGPA